MHNFDELKKILLQFQAQLEKKRTFYESTRTLNPSFDPVSEESCQKELARCWIYGSHNIATVLQAGLPKIPYHSKASHSLASEHYTDWQTTIEKGAAPNSEYAEYFLNDVEYRSYHLEEPNAGEKLYDYVIRLQEIIENKEKIHYLWERGFSSFLHHLRQTIPKEQIAFLELIFPEESEIRKITTFKPVKTGKSTWKLKEVPYGQIARKISPQVYPIFILTAVDIIRELANAIVNGRHNAILTAAESLGLCWVCLTYARLGLPIDLKDILSLPITALKRTSDNNFPLLTLPSIFGSLPTPVSDTIWDFLKALSEIPRKQSRPCIFQCPDESLYRSLRRTIERLGVDPSKGKITFQTFLSQPSEFDHRFQPK